MVKKIDAHDRKYSMFKKIFFEIFDKLPIKNPDEYNDYECQINIPSPPTLTFSRKEKKKMKKKAKK